MTIARMIGLGLLIGMLSISVVKIFQSQLDSLGRFDIYQDHIEFVPGK